MFFSRFTVKIDKTELEEEMEVLGEAHNATRIVRKRKLYQIWKCKKCYEEFDTSRKLKDHRKLHKKDPEDTHYNYCYDVERSLYTCNTCDIETTKLEEIENHVIEHEEKYICEKCNEPFFKPYEFSCHMYKHDPDGQFPCPLCKYTTPRRTAIMIHINTYHLRKFIYTCDQCGKGFNDCVLYREHENIHRGIKPFQCVVCSREFTFSSYLTAHQVRNHKVNIEGTIAVNQCPLCLKNFAKAKTLESHIDKHNQEPFKKVHEKKHLCDICGKGFARIEKLRIHYRVHTGVKPYTCSYCAKSFTKKDYLIMHERVHSGEKPYSCEFCGKCFNQGAPLRLHIRGHTGERPYNCHLCGGNFISRGVLNLHFRSCPGR